MVLQWRKQLGKEKQLEKDGVIEVLMKRRIASTAQLNPEQVLGGYRYQCQRHRDLQLNKRTDSSHKSAHCNLTSSMHVN
jgi:hypothetical protein